MLGRSISSSDLLSSVCFLVLNLPACSIHEQTVSSVWASSQHKLTKCNHFLQYLAAKNRTCTEQNQTEIDCAELKNTFEYAPKWFNHRDCHCEKYSMRPVSPLQKLKSNSECQIASKWVHRASKIFSDICSLSSWTHFFLYVCTVLSLPR